MELEKPSAHGVPPRQQDPEGCLVVAIRIPVRIVVLVLVLPVRMAWDALVVGGRFLQRTVLRPLGQALSWVGRVLFVRPVVGLWRYVVVPVGAGLAWAGKLLAAGLARLGNLLAVSLAWLGRTLVVAPALWCHRYLLTPLGRALLALLRGTGAGAAWLYARLLTPVGRAAAWVLRGVGLVLAALATGVCAGVVWLVRYLVAVPAVWTYRWILAPVGRGAAWLAGAVLAGTSFCLYWTARVLLVLPALALWRRVLLPVGRFLAVVAREVGDALGHAWRIAGHISLRVGRLLGTLFRWIFVEPVRRAYRSVLTPVGHFLRDAVLRPAAAAAREVGRAVRQTYAAVREPVRQALAAARDSVRQTRADVRRALFGDPRRPEAVARREPSGREARTLGSSTTALTKD
ncbi:hypothetical protein FNH09_27510 [Streptomyces adustus]|uniref:Uncharacterized protein n=1 Tax=Streptomyces adustus TaxID=1609272 RepID=A0A5N8VLA0_9ACTN|nr:hypothetical protein [Streptomyces adustus]MPY34848.1 hypothetical protein [Streptomyces adustus]